MAGQIAHLLTSDESQRIADAVVQRLDDAIAFLTEVVKVPSENPKLTGRAPAEEGQCQDLIGARLDALGMDVDRFEALPGRPNVVGRKVGTGAGRSLVFNGHVDVVPAGDADDWRYPPFEGVVADGAVWGRGACDMKGGLVTALLAIEALAVAGVDLAGDILVHSVVDEETGGSGTRAAIEHGSVADGAICVEPTNLEVMPVEGGLEWLRLIVHGVAGHTALRYKSVHAGGGAPATNAIEKMVKILTAVQSLEREWGIRKRHPLLPVGITTINPGIMLGGTGGGADGMPHIITSPSTFPDYCSLELSLKYLPSETREDVRREFETFIGHVAATDPWLAEHPPEIEWGVRGVSFPPAETSPDHPLITTLARQIQAVADRPLVITGFTAVSDIAWLAEAGIPCTLFGPGRADYAHAVDERIAIDEIRVGAVILACTAAEWCGIVRHAPSRAGDE